MSKVKKTKATPAPKKVSSGDKRFDNFMGKLIKGGVAPKK